MTLLYDPRPLEDPAYWANEQTIEDYCQQLEWALADKFDIIKDKEDLVDDWYAQWHYESGDDVYVAALAISEDPYDVYSEEA